jgi:ABC-type uncharacterized transport system substrate-binding protein
MRHKPRKSKVSISLNKKEELKKLIEEEQNKRAQEGYMQFLRDNNKKG